MRWLPSPLVQQDASESLLSQVFGRRSATEMPATGGGGGGGVLVRDEGTPLGSFTALNFTGSGVTATDAGGGVAQIAVPGGGGGLVSGQIVVTVPAPGRIEHIETLAAASVTGSMRILLSVGPHADTDENTAEMLSIDAMEGLPGTGTITATLAFSEPTAGPIRLNYLAV